MCVIAAGLLLEFILNEVSFPVGRVISKYLYPLSFFEFLDAIGLEDRRKYIQELPLDKPVHEQIHNELMLALKKYIRIGGMPYPIKVYDQTDSFQKVSEAHEQLVSGYQDDFIKYAQIIIKVFESNALTVPLKSGIKSDFFKLLFIDIGLLNYLYGFDWKLLSQESSIESLRGGAIAEQFIGQQLLSYSSNKLFYWHRDSRGSTAEVDFLLDTSDGILPIEVKSGKRGTFKSLKMYLEKVETSRRNKYSSIVFADCLTHYSKDKKILFLPLYLVEKIKSL